MAIVVHVCPARVATTAPTRSLSITTQLPVLTITSSTGNFLNKQNGKTLYKQNDRARLDQRQR